MTNGTCKVPGCGRRVHAAGLCRSHYAKQGKPDALAPLRAQRARGEAESLSGLSLSRSTVQAIKSYATKHQKTVHAVMVEILERWAKRQGKQRN